MSEQNKTITKRIFDEGWNGRKLDVCDELIAKDAPTHEPGLPPEASIGPESLKGIIGIYTGAFPDVKMTLEDMVAEGDRVVVRWQAIGTNTGSLMGMPPTGKKSTVTGTLIYRFADGKVAEAWSLWDKAGMMQQLTGA